MADADWTKAMDMAPKYEVRDTVTNEKGRYKRAMRWGSLWRKEGKIVHMVEFGGRKNSGDVEMRAIAPEEFGLRYRVTELDEGKHLNDKRKRFPSPSNS